ncbi:MAG: 1-acyl-sn-glycerol-3-phosphate acyltransferase [Clostridia bacterium]|nr:1-acyl-sn-glycerol-3-phosphate acyltransferase [Clostridia bacterium]
MKKTKKWTKFRHRVVTRLVQLALGPYTRLKYGIKVEKFLEQGNRQYLILFNHQTAFDQFFVGLAFKGPVYYVASEDLFSNGTVSSLIKYLVAPIPIRKQSADVHAVINCMRVAKEGGTIAMAPEGNRTYSGETSFINPAVVPLAKKLGLPIALFRIEGGFGTHPRWADKVRRGKMRCYVSKVLEPEEYEKMTNEELYSLITSALYVNEAKLDSEYKHKKLAENLERAIYVCRKCGLSSFTTKNDIIECQKCGEQVRYLPTKQLLGVNGKFPFEFLLDWYNYQSDFVNSLNTEQLCCEPLYTERIHFYEIIPHKKRRLLRAAATLRLYGNRITLDEGEKNELIFLFDELSGATVLGKNKLNIYKQKHTYQIKGDKSFCALKYVNILFRHKAIIKGETNGKFLGL